MNVVPVGYSGTGSSAITHLISEFEFATDMGMGTYEHVLLYHPNGLFDLGAVLNGMNSIYRSDAAIKAFRKSMKKLNNNDFGWFGGYEKLFNGRFEKLVDDFVESISEFKREGNWYYDYEIVERKSYALKDAIKHILRKNVQSFGKRIDVNNQEIIYSFISEDKFYSAAREFVRGYLNLFNPTNKVGIFDQLVLPHNLHFVDKYFPGDTKFIVVDRDPRDMYVLSKYVWPLNTGIPIFPTNPKSFVEFYSGLRGMEKPFDSDSILRIHFEDLVYKYDDTVKVIKDFIGSEVLGSHKYKFSRFDPEKSIHNTQNFRIEKIWEKEVGYIEEMMNDDLYDFPYVFKPLIQNTSDPQ